MISSKSFFAGSELLTFVLKGAAGSGGRVHAYLRRSEGKGWLLGSFEPLHLDMCLPDEYWFQYSLELGRGTKRFRE